VNLLKFRLPVYNNFIFNLQHFELNSTVTFSKLSAMKLIALLWFFVVSTLVNSKFHCRQRKLECSSSLKTIQNQTCFIKSFKRGDPVISGSLVLKRTLTDVKVKHIRLEVLLGSLETFQLFHAVYRKNSDNKFMTIYSLAEVPVCRVLAGLKIVPVLEILLKDIRTIAPDLLNICSKTKEIKAMNLSCSRSVFVSRLPVGEYKAEFRLFDEEDDNIANATLFTQLFH
jgi:hypothetical protein